MPLQNRVDPWGRLHATPARGALLGNRGVIHDHAQTIVTPWRWSFDGYARNTTPAPAECNVQVLTPASLVRMFKAGFRPGAHALRP